MKVKHFPRGRAGGFSPPCVNAGALKPHYGRSGCSAIFSRYRRMHMAHQAKDEAREERIHMEIIVDAYGPEEQAISWYYYLDENLHFPFSARCIVHRATSPLKPGDEVEVVGMPSEEECEHDMFVMIRWKTASARRSLDAIGGYWGG